jgi:hypothetical protein
VEVVYINVAILIDVRIGAVDVVRVLSKTPTHERDIDRAHDPIAVHVRVRRDPGDAGGWYECRQQRDRAGNGDSASDTGPSGIHGVGLVGQQAHRFPFLPGPPNLVLSL